MNQNTLKKIALTEGREFISLAVATVLLAGALAGGNVMDENESLAIADDLINAWEKKNEKQNKKAA